MLSRLVYAKVFMKGLAAERMKVWTVHEGEGLQGGIPKYHLKLHVHSGSSQMP